MPAGGFKTFVAGEILTAADTNSFLMQGVLVFADATARDEAITTPVEGQFAFLKDTNVLTFHDGVAFVEFSTDPPAAVISASTGSPTPFSGAGFEGLTFTGDGTITFSKGGFARFLLVSGGGAGGEGSRGAGGGGGSHYSVLEGFFPEGTTTVTVGPGGPRANTGSNAGVAGNNGGVSKIGDYLAPGGGGGGHAGVTSAGANVSLPGLNGCSGGGSGGFTAGGTRLAGTGFAPLGFNGGQGVNPGAGGGGGSGAIGANGVGNVGGNGGAGESSDITGTSVQRGGGGGGFGATLGTGGAGGGGNGGASGTANTGGGGGGGSGFTLGGNGGSGIVIVRVAV